MVGGFPKQSLFQLTSFNRHFPVFIYSLFSLMWYLFIYKIISLPIHHPSPPLPLTALEQTQSRSHQAAFLAHDTADPAPYSGTSSGTRHLPPSPCLFFAVGPFL